MPVTVVAVPVPVLVLVPMPVPRSHPSLLQHPVHRHRRAEPGDHGHAQDRPGRGLRRMRRCRPVPVRVAMTVIMRMTVVEVVGRSHQAMLHYNITPV